MPTVGKASEIASGQMTGVDLQGVRVAIARVEGAFYAFSDICTHLGCSLSEGKLEGMVLTCPCHGSQFDIASGHVLTGPAVQRIRTYQVQIEGDELRI